jgi:DNA processing protein
VTVVGTRSATGAGLELAHGIGRDLAGSGAVVVSGLAHGIDSAVLAGALGARRMPPVAVLGAAHDAQTPQEQLALRRRIADVGAVLSELPPGAPSARWRFAVRNRVMAAAAQLVVVVECHCSGGSLHTVRAARRRGVPVAAVPGSLRSPASAGTNALLVDGAHCVRSGADTVALLSRLTGWVPGSAVVSGGQPTEREPAELDGPAAAVLAALDHDAAGLDTVVLRSGVDLGEAAVALERLAEQGLAVSEGGFWCRQ